MQCTYFLQIVIHLYYQKNPSLLLLRGPFSSPNEIYFSRKSNQFEISFREENKENIFESSKEISSPLFKTPIARASVKREHDVVDLTVEIPMFQNNTPISRKFGNELQVSFLQFSSYLQIPNISPYRDSQRKPKSKKVAPIDLNSVLKEEELAEMPSLESTLPIMESPGLSPIFPVKPAKKQRLLTPMLSTPLLSSIIFYFLCSKLSRNKIQVRKANFRRKFPL